MDSGVIKRRSGKIESCVYNPEKFHADSIDSLYLQDKQFPTYLFFQDQIPTSLL